MDLTERKDELALAQKDLVRATEQVEEIEAALGDLEQAKNDYASNMNTTKEEYENAIEEMKEQYEHMTEEIRQQFIKRINERYMDFHGKNSQITFCQIFLLLLNFFSFIAYQAQFTSMRENYRSAMESMILSVEDKSYSMKVASMTQRYSLISIINYVL